MLRSVYNAPADDAEPQLRLDGFLPYRLSIAANRVSDAIAGAYRALFGLSVPEWRLIAVLAEGALSQQALTGRTRMDKVTVSRAAARLVARGLLIRDAAPGDRRSHLLALSEPGRALYREVAPKALELERRIFTSFSAEDRAALAALLARVEAAVDTFDGA